MQSENKLRIICWNNDNNDNLIKLIATIETAPRLHQSRRCSCQVAEAEVCDALDEFPQRRFAHYISKFKTNISLKLTVENCSYCDTMKIQQSPGDAVLLDLFILISISRELWAFGADSESHLFVLNGCGREINWLRSSTIGRIMMQNSNKINRS